MGCSASKNESLRGETRRETVKSGGAKKNKVEADSAQSMSDSVTQLQPPPPIPVLVGSGVAPFDKDARCVIFVFGGPGSQKGMLIEELVHEFEFVSITVEDIVFSYLPNKMANTVESITEIQDLLKKDTSTLSVEWILNLISAKLSTSVERRFIIDIVPCLNTILKNDTFLKDDHTKELESFERRHNIMFALDLRVPDEKGLLSKRTPGINIDRAGQDPASSTKSKDGEKDEPDKNNKNISAELSAFLRGIDEADKGRMERRIDLYHGCANAFLRYFHKTNRVVRVEIVSSVREHLIKSLRDFLCEFGFTTNHDSIRVVMFAFNETQASGVDIDYYRMKKVVLSEIVYDRNENLSSMIRAVRTHINRIGHALQNFLVVLDILNESNDQQSKRINFLEKRHCYLDHYIRLRANTPPRNRYKTPFYAITSTNAEVCLFPDGFPLSLCKRIGFVFGERLNASETNSINLSRTSNTTESPTDGDAFYNAKNNNKMRRLNNKNDKNLAIGYRQ